MKITKRPIIQCFMFVLFLALLIDCGKKVMVPPRIDLSNHEVVGIIEFACSEKGKIGPLCTGRFMEFDRRDFRKASGAGIGGAFLFGALKPDAVFARSNEKLTFNKKTGETCTILNL